MVFESIVADVLNRVLSKYVENVDQSQLNIGIWGGDVTLENLLLKENALDELDLPIKATYGQLAKLVLKIPWKNLYTAPVVICVERLFLLAVPNRDIKYDPVKEEQWLQSAKEYELQKVEDIKRKLREKDHPPADDTFTQKLVAQVIKNVQIKVKDIHIRYEDRVTHVEKPFALGITLAHFYVCTTDANWVETVVQENVTKVNKLIDVESLAVYWNCNCHFFKETCAKEKKTLMTVFQETICTKEHQPHGFDYILEPINASTKMLMNTKPEIHYYRLPKLDVDIQMNTLAVGINKLQYGELVRLSESLNRMALSATYRKYRPHLNVYRGNYRKWWRFAYTCVVEEDIRRVHLNWSWRHMTRHRARCRAYADAYAKKIMAVKPSDDQETRVRDLEKCLDVLNILLVRERVEMEVEKAGLLRSVVEKRGSWIPRFGRASVDNDYAHVLHSLERAMTPNEKEKLYKAIDFKEHSNPVQYPSMFVDLRVKFNLDTFQIEITDKGIFKFRVVHVAFTRVSLDLERRPNGNGIKANAKIFRLSVYGLKRGHVTPLLVTTKKLKKDENLLDVQFELNPLDHACDQRLLVFLKSLQVIHDSKTIQRVFDVFRAPFSSSTLHKLQVQLESVKDMSATGLQYAIEQHAALEMKVDVRAPYIIVPRGGFYTHDEQILVLNFGRLTISSFPRNPAQNTVRRLHTKGVSDEGILRTMISQSYDKFFVNLENVQVLVALEGEDWLGVLEKSQATPLHLLEPLCFIVMFNNCLVRDDPKLPKAKLTGTVKRVKINVTNVRLLHLLTILSSIPPLDVHKEKDPEDELPVETPSQRTGAYLMQAYWDAKGERQKRDDFKKEMRDQTGVNKVQAILMDLTFELERITVKGFRVEAPAISFETTKHFFTLEIIKMEVELVQQTFDMDLVAKLGGVSMDVNDGKKEVRLIDTAMTANDRVTEYLLNVNYKFVDKQSPELRVKYGNTLQFLQVDISTVKVVLHQEALLSFIDVMYKLKVDLEIAVGGAKMPVKVPSTTKRKQFKDVQRKVLQRVRERKMMTILKPQKKLKKQTEQTKLRMQVNMKQLKITITTRTTLIVDIIISRCEIKIIVLTSLTKLLLRLKTIQIFDGNPKSHHSRILSVLGDEILSIEVIKYNVCKLFSYDRSETPDMVLKAKISRIRFIYLNRFVLSLLTFYSNVQVGKTFFAEEASEVNPPGRETRKELVGDADFVQMTVDFEAPIIIVPLSSLSMEAVMLHLGYITITNECHVLSVVNKNGVAAAADCIQFKLQDLKANRVKLDKTYHVINAVTLLEPVDFDVEIERNLSTSWHKCVPDCEVYVRVPELCFTLTEEDCNMAMEIMFQNFSEADEVQLNEELDTNIRCSMEQHHPFGVRGKEFDSTSGITVVSNLDRFSAFNDAIALNKTSSESTRIAQKICLVMDGITVSLFTGGAKTLDDTPEKHSRKDLAIFSMRLLYFGSLWYSNGNQRFTLRIGNCYLDDVRRIRAKKYTRLVQLKDEPVLQSTPSRSREHTRKGTGSRCLMDITYLKKDWDTFVDVKIHGIQIIIGLDYVVELREFITSHSNATEKVVDLERPQQESRKVRFLRASSSFSNSATKLKRSVDHIDLRSGVDRDSAMTVNIKIDQPDIIFVESIDNTDSNALFVNVDIIARVQFVSERMVLNACIKNLQFYVCCFDATKRAQTKTMILRPCTTSFVGFASGDGEFNIDVYIADIKIDLAPGTIDLLSKIYYALYGYSTDPLSGECNEVDYSQLWEPKHFSSGDFWFLKKDGEGRSLSKFSHNSHMLGKSEICVVSVPSVIITLEAGDGKQRQPLLLVEFKLECIVYDWSSSLFVNVNLALQIAYYNTGMALWEPLLEPVERVLNGMSSHHPWELKMIVKLNEPTKRTNFTHISRMLDAEDLPQNTALSVSISSSDKLDLTLTKSGLEVLYNLSGAIFEANKCSTSVGVAAPYVVRNVSGLPVTVIFHDGPFRLMAPATNGDHNLKPRHHQVTLESGGQLELCLREEEEEKEEREEREHTAKKLLKHGGTLSGINIDNEAHVNKKFLCVRVRVDSQYWRVLSVPMFRADKRYFSLKTRGPGGVLWGMVSDVRICNGGTILTLRGIIKVHNHMKTPISVEYCANPGEKLKSVGLVHPDDELLLPIYCVYTATNELFFRVEEYKPTQVPLNWRQLRKAHITHKLFTCAALESRRRDPFFINVVGISNPIIFENGSYYTPDSVSYNVHLRPAVVIRNLLTVDVMVRLESTNIKEDTLVKAGKQLHMVHAEPGKSKISLTITSYYQKKWLVDGYIQWTASSVDVLRFTSGESDEKKSLQLQLHKVESDGTICLQLCSQFWMVNKTGLSLSYRQFDDHNNTWNHGEELKEPVLFSYWGATNTKKTLSIAIADGEWSEKFSLDATGSSGVVACKLDGTPHLIGVYVHLSHTRLTKQVVFTPFYVLVNNHATAIECREAELLHGPWVAVAPGDCTPFWPCSTGTRKEIRLRVVDSGDAASSPFSFASVHSTLVKVPVLGGVFVDVHKIDAAVYVTFLPYKPGLAPTLLINHTDEPIGFYEDAEEKTETLNAREMAFFTWDKPVGARIITYQLGTKKDFADDLRTDFLQEFVSRSGDVVYVVSFMDGFQRVTLFTSSKRVAKTSYNADKADPIDMEIDISLQAVGISFVNNATMKELLYLSAANSEVIWETRSSEKTQFKPLDADESQQLEEAYMRFVFDASLGRETEKVVNIGDHLKVNLETKEVIHPPKRYLRRSYEEGLWCQMRFSRHQSTLLGKMNRLQIDNQLCDSVFPVMFAPVALPKTIRANRKQKPFAEWYIVRQYMEHNPVKHYKYFKVLVQEFHVKVDMNFLVELWAFLDSGELSELAREQQFDVEIKLAAESLLNNVYTSSLREEKSFYELLHFSPLKIHVSFSLSAKGQNVAEEGGDASSPNVAMALLRGLGVTVTDVHDVVLRVRYFERKNTFSTYNQMYAEVYSHYANEFLKNAYVLIFGLDLIGNPWGFLVGITKGVQDLFYEPYLGAIQGAEDFGRGVLLGVGSLFGSAVGGVCGAVSRISGALGTGVAVLTFDHDFQRRRKEIMNKMPPELGARLMQSGKALVTGMVDGMSGVVTKPVSGATRDGVAGFCTGVGKGFAGLVTRPTVAVFDFVSGSLSVVPASKAVAQVRPPRYLNPDGLVRPYVRTEAEGHAVLHGVERGTFVSTDNYIYHVTGVNGKRDVLLLTDQRVMYIEENAIIGYTLQWQCPWDQMQPPRVDADGSLVFSSVNARRSSCGRCGAPNISDPILIKSRQQRKILQRHIKHLAETCTFECV